MRVVDFFSGIGGFALGLEMAGGFETVAFSEIDPYCCRVLEKHWPEVPNLGSVDNGGRDTVPEILHGFEGPENGQGSVAGPVLLLENVSGFRRSVLPAVLRDLAAIGFDAEWFTVCSCHFDAPHHRERVFVIAYPNGQGEPFGSIHAEVASLRTIPVGLP